jgi:hypothetical protein
MNLSPPLNLPESLSRIRIRDGRREIWDAIRKRWLILTPEEWVRQQMIGYLVGCKGVDPLWIRQEHRLTLHGTSRRADIVIYDVQASPRMIVECKAPQVGLTRQVLEQAVRYNLVMRVPYILITNGLEHYCYRYDAEGNRLDTLDEIPDFSPASE